MLASTSVSVPTPRAAEYFVDNTSASCSNSGPGSVALPYCSITAALAAHHEPGTTITVLPGVYREQVTVPGSGAPGDPIVLRASPGSLPVIVDGRDDFSDPSAWEPFFGDVWLADSVTWSPRQVFADSARLSPSTADPTFLPERSFRYVLGAGLYVNAGGGNPGDHATQVGRRTYVFFVSGRSWVRIEGFTVLSGEDRCIQVTNSSNVEILGNRVRLAGRFGLQAQGDSAVRLASNVVSECQGHGISLTAFTARSTVEDNESFGNADPNVRVANGLYVYSSPRNLVQRNRWHHNQDTGQHFSGGSHDNVSLANRSWSNGDHGFDHVGSTGATHVNDVAFANLRDGFSVEGASTNTSLHDCISVENGTTTLHYDLFVDTTSTSGFDSDDNVFWNSGPRPPIKFAKSAYASVASYSAARGHDTRTLQADPRFAAPTVGDFHLLPDSPAIDNANSDVAQWPSTDAEGRDRADDPAIPNLGLGAIAYADRGALEFQGSTAPPNQPPTAHLTLAPGTGTAPLFVRANASGSFDPDGQRVSYEFDLGDGTHLGPQDSSYVDHLYAAGTWTVQLTVSDSAGATSTAAATLEVGSLADNLVTDSSFESGTTGWAPLGGAQLQRVPGGHAGSSSLLASAPEAAVAEYGLTDQPDWVRQTPGAGAQYHFLVWLRAGQGLGFANLRVRETLDAFSGPWISSAPVPLSSTWTSVELDLSTRFARSALDLQIVNRSGGTGGSFSVDDISIQQVIGPSLPGPADRPTHGTDPEPADFAPRFLPNPTGFGGARFRFTTSRAGNVELELFDLAGRRVRRLVHDPATPAGAHSTAFDGRADDGSRLPAGLYHFLLRTPAGVKTGRLVVLDY